MSTQRGRATEAARSRGVTGMIGFVSDINNVLLQHITSDSSRKLYPPSHGRRPTFHSGSLSPLLKRPTLHRSPSNASAPLACSSRRHIRYPPPHPTGPQRHRVPETCATSASGARATSSYCAAAGAQAAAAATDPSLPFPSSRSALARRPPALPPSGVQPLATRPTR